MVMDRTRLVAGVIIMGYAALQLLLYVVLSKRKYQKSYRQYEAELQNYEIQKQKEQKQLTALREQYKRTTAKPAQNAYIEPNIKVTVEYDYADSEDEYDFADAEDEYDFMVAEEDDEEERRRLEKEQEELDDYQHEMAYWCEVDEWMAKGGPESGEAPPQW